MPVIQDVYMNSTAHSQPTRRLSSLRLPHSQLVQQGSDGDGTHPQGLAASPEQREPVAMEQLRIEVAMPAAAAAAGAGSWKCVTGVGLDVGKDGGGDELPVISLPHVAMGQGDGASWATDYSPCSGRIDDMCKAEALAGLQGVGRRREARGGRI